MAPRNVFKVITATIGLLGVGYGLLYFIDGLLSSFGLPVVAPGSGRYYMARGVIEIALGLAFMRGVPAIVAIAFPERPVQTDGVAGDVAGGTGGEDDPL